MSTRTATLNVPCTGKFNIEVESDGFYDVVLAHTDGIIYNRTSGTISPAGTFSSGWTGDSIIIPKWMWECVTDKINELTIAMERDSIVTPNTVQNYVQ